MRIDQFHPVFDEADSKAVADVIASGWTSEGPKTKEFEQKVAAIMGYRYGIATNNGTIALALALMAAGVGFRDVVSVPDLTFMGTANAVKLVGAAPVFEDINEGDFCSIFVDIPVALNGRHVSGGIVIDAAQALGSSIGKAQMATLSFAPNKIITTAQGGMVFTDETEIAEKVRRLKDHGRLDKADYYPSFGFNAKFSDLQAALGLSQLEKLPGRIEHKKARFEQYREELAALDSSGLIVGVGLSGETLWNQDILVEKREMLILRLSRRGIETRPFYAPLHSQPVYQNDEKRFPVTEKISARGLWLPSSPDLTPEEVSYVCDAIRMSLR